MSTIFMDWKDELFTNVVCDTMPTHSMYTHNLDFSTFPFLCEEVYKHLISLTSSRLFSFAAFQHYMTVLLNCHLIKYKYYESFLVPGPIAEYFSNINTVTVLTGDKVQVNVPEIAIPQFTVPEDEFKAQIPPGSFGRLTAENHNVYECYVSPYITRKLVEQTREQCFGPWNPLPVGAYPYKTIPNKNLLGYAEPEELDPNLISILKEYEFPNTNDMQGRLQIVPILMSHISNSLKEIESYYCMVRLYTKKEKSTQKTENLVGVTKVSTMPYGIYTHNTQISKIVGDIFSPYALKSISVKMSMLYGFKRLRTSVIPGFCYTTPNGEVPNEWEHSINYNFNMKEPFRTTMYPDYSHLRDEYQIASLPKGYKTDSINDWIKSYDKI